MRQRLRWARAFLEALVPDDDARALVVQLPLIAVAALGIGLALHARVPGGPRWARASALARSGDPAGAEHLYWNEVRRGEPPVPLLLELIDNHAALQLLAGLDGTIGGAAPERPRPVVTDRQIEELLRSDRLPRRVALVALYHWEAQAGTVSEPLRERIEDAAAADPPVPWANHVLARDAEEHDRLAEAADRYAREGLHFRGRRDDARRALHLWLALEDWRSLSRALRDPRWKGLVDPRILHAHALRAGDPVGAVRWLLVANLHPELGPLLVALVAAFMWFGFVARLGKIGKRPRLRGSLYALAFLLGVASVAPTLLLVTVEEHFLGLRETGDAVRDVIYFVAGVGLREELCKLLFFAPLLPLIRRHGSRLDVLACGAMVGLGFAAEENVGYFSAGASAAATGRFLTANFMHIAMTAICADALADLVESPERRSYEFTTRLLTVVALHGLYDFFLTSQVVGDLSFFAMMIFVLLTRQFLTAVGAARGQREPNDRFVRRLVQAIAVVAAASFVYGCAHFGPTRAATILGMGMFGNAIIVYMFVHETRRT